MSAIPASSVSLKTMADGTLRISFDVEPSQAQDAFKLFAAPGTQVAIAALRDGSFLDHAPDNSIPQNLETDKSRINPGEKPEKQKIGDACLLAVRWCADPQFWEWLESVVDPRILWACKNEQDAKDFICTHCGVDSRKELDTDPAALNIWHQDIRKPYRDYLAAKCKS